MRKRYVIPVAADNGPTVERAAKADFEDSQREGRPIRRKSDALAALVRSGHIEQQHVDAANRWYRDLVLAEAGYFEIAQMRDDFLGDEAERDRVEAGALRHDAISWRVMRGRAACRLSVVREIVRRPGEMLLRFIVADGITFEEMARRVIPGDGGYNAGRQVKAQCALVLQQLEDIYRPESRHLFDVCYLPREDVLRRRGAMESA